MFRQLVIIVTTEDETIDRPDHSVAAAISELLQSPPWGLHPSGVTLTVHDLPDPTAGGRQGKLFDSGSGS
jgi:hypothetical protein